MLVRLFDHHNSTDMLGGMQSTQIEIFRDGHWLPAATLEPLADDRARLDYLPEYIFSNDPWPVSLALPVAFTAPDESGRWPAPAFLYDLVPQGKGRKLLVDLLGVRDHDALVLPLVLAGAFNPVGALRLASASGFCHDHLRGNPPPPSENDGFTRQELASKEHHVLEHLSTYAMLASGTTGVQGVSPKFLLTEDMHGRLHADLALDDTRARAHWLVKGPRNSSDDDRTVLRNEAAYLRVAAACGLRVHAPAHITHASNLLFVPRFDRHVSDGTVQRLHQESLASLAGLQGFGVPCHQNRLLQALRAHASDPLAETIEFLRRDVLNLAMRNTDNHARNHAVQRLPDGRIQLTPLFDFAPMYLDPELIARSLHWVDAAGVRVHTWTEALDWLALPDAERETVRVALRAFASTVAALPATMRDHGVDTPIIEACRQSIDGQARQLAAL